jgi:hypothetical protein
MKRRILVATLAAGLVALWTPLYVAAHVHVVNNPNHSQELANGQNHPGFVYNPATNTSTSCEGVNEPANAGPAGYGLETAHHGPDQGTPGKADGCYAQPGAPPPPDGNPAID